jgi:hypothetical protein
MFPTLSIEAARQAQVKRQAGEPWSGTPFVRWVGEGSKFPESRADVLLDKLSELRASLAAEPLPTNKGKEFEGPASALVHKELQICPRTAGNREFWLWLTFVAADGAYADIVDWRFGTQESIDPVNFGIARRSAMWEGLFARLWLRGNIGFDAASQDPYRIAKKGDIDIWRSHIIRTEYGRCKPVAHALLNYQYPDGTSEKPLSVKELRELAKKLRIADASISYELLDGGAIKEIIEDNVERIRASAELELTAEDEIKPEDEVEPVGE